MFHLFLNLSSFAARFVGYAVAVYISFRLGEHLYPCYALVLSGETIHAADAVMTWRSVRSAKAEGPK